MTKITIPKKFGYPTMDITINGIEHTFNTGVEVEMEDEVAEVIENALALAPKIGRNKSRLAELVEGSIKEITADDLDGIETISPHVFYNSDNITSIVIPHGVKSIALSAFSYCGRLTNVTMPDTLTSIGEKAFMKCEKLNRVIVKALTPPTIQTDTFSEVPATCVFEVPSEALNTYKAASGWSVIANQIVAIKE